MLSSLRVLRVQRLSSLWQRGRSLSSQWLRVPRVPQPEPSWARALAKRAAEEGLAGSSAQSALSHVTAMLQSSARASDETDSHEPMSEVISALVLGMAEANEKELAEVPLEALAAAVSECLEELGLLEVDIESGEAHFAGVEAVRKAARVLHQETDDEEEEEEEREEERREELKGSSSPSDGLRDYDDEPADIAELRAILAENDESVEEEEEEEGENEEEEGSEETERVLSTREAKAKARAEKEASKKEPQLQEVNFDLGRLPHERGRRKGDWMESVRHQRISTNVAEALRTIVYVDNVSDTLVQGEMQLVDVSCGNSEGFKRGSCDVENGPRPTLFNVWVGLKMADVFSRSKTPPAFYVCGGTGL